MAYTSFESLHDLSRVWIYRSSIDLSDEQVLNINQWLLEFIEQWTAHNQTLKSHGSVYHNKFIVICLDEYSSSQASGCSIDSQVRFIKDIGNSLNIDFFDRLHFDFFISDSVVSYHKDEVKDMIDSGQLDKDPIVLDHLVKNKSEFEKKWMKPLSTSWHSNLI